MRDQTENDHKEAQKHCESLLFLGEIDNSDGRSLANEYPSEIISLHPSSAHETDESIISGQHEAKPQHDDNHITPTASKTTTAAIIQMGSNGRNTSTGKRSNRDYNDDLLKEHSTACNKRMKSHKLSSDILLSGVPSSRSNKVWSAAIKLVSDDSLNLRIDACKDPDGNTGIPAAEETLEKTKQKFLDNREETRNAEAAAAVARRRQQPSSQPAAAAAAKTRAKKKAHRDRNGSYYNLSSKKCTPTLTKLVPRRPVPIYPILKDRCICFEWDRHPATVEWRGVIKFFSDDRTLYPEWNDEITDYVKEMLAEDFFSRFLVFLDADERSCVSIHEGLWYEATENEIAERTKEQFLTNRRDFDEAHDAKGEVTPKRELNDSSSPALATRDELAPSESNDSKMERLSQQQPGAQTGLYLSQCSEAYLANLPFLFDPEDGPFSDTSAEGCHSLEGARRQLPDEAENPVDRSSLTSKGSDSAILESSASGSDYASSSEKKHETPTEGFYFSKSSGSACFGEMLFLFDPEDDPTSSDALEHPPVTPDSDETETESKSNVDSCKSNDDVVGIKDNTLAVHFGWISHPATNTWREVVKKFSDDHVQNPTWTDNICHQVTEMLENEEGIHGYLVCRDNEGKPVRRMLDEHNRCLGIWSTATHTEILERTKHRFLDARKPARRTLEQIQDPSHQIVPCIRNRGKPPNKTTKRTSESSKIIRSDVAMAGSQAVLALKDTATTYNNETLGSLEMADQNYNNGNVCLRQQEWAKAQGHYEIMLSIFAIKAPGSLTMASAYHNLGVVCDKQGKWVQARSFFETARDIYKIKASDSVYLAESYVQLGGVCRKKEEWARAKHCLKKAIAIYANKAPESLMLAGTYYNLGTVCNEQYEWSEAQAIFQIAMKIYGIKDPYSLAIARTYHNLGVVHENLQDLTQAERFYEKAMEIFTMKAADSLDLATTYHNLGYVCDEQQEWEQAQHFYEKAIEIYAVKAPESLELATTFSALGYVFEEQQQREQAQHFYDKAMSIHEINKALAAHE